MEWDFRAAFPASHFDVIFACPPCEQMSRARTTKPRDMVAAERLVVRTLEIVRHFRPARWFIENPRGGLMKTLLCMADVPYVDLDYCQFSTWGYQKPTRFWGGAHVQGLSRGSATRPRAPTLNWWMVGWCIARGWEETTCCSSGRKSIGSRRIWFGTSVGFRTRKSCAEWLTPCCDCRFALQETSPSKGLTKTRRLTGTYWPGRSCCRKMLPFCKTCGSGREAGPRGRRGYLAS